MNRISAETLAKQHGGRCYWSQSELMHVIVRSDGHEFRINREMLTFLNAVEFRRRYLEIPPA